jgi:hypothetical protein
MTLDRSFAVVTCAALAGALLPATSRADGSATPCEASIDARSHLGRLTPIAVGANAAAWDGNLVNADVAPLLTDAGIGLIRYPGGSTADNYLITVNYGSGTAADAAGWVQYANEGSRHYHGPVPT